MDGAWVRRGLGLGLLAFAVVGCASGESEDDRGGPNRSDSGSDEDAGAGNGGSAGGRAGRGGSGGRGGNGSVEDAGCAEGEDTCLDAGPSCGNGVVDPSLDEGCDDGNADSLDGCSASCQLETNFACGTPGTPCFTTVECGDGFIGGTELCDDRDQESGNGCSGDCQTIEPGWACPAAGVACQASQCGDGLVVGFEACDDLNGGAGDGCDESCQLEPGYACESAGAACDPIECGDGDAQGLEQCDDENADTGDGCSPLCQREPVCERGVCTARCGDGLKLEAEACDDGNQRAGDGCSDDCLVEAGFTCEIQIENPVLPIVYRDFIGAGGRAPGVAVEDGPIHPDFENGPFGTNCSEQVETTLDADGKPVLEDASRVGNCVTSEASFAQWYRSGSLNRTVIDQLTFVPSDADGEPLAIPPANPTRFGFRDTSFFPLTDRGWNAIGDVREIQRNDNSVDANDDPAPVPRNFHFTSELRYWFTYQGGERLTFFGDDDVWVFINRRLAVDIAGIHGQRQRYIVLPGPNGDDPSGETGSSNAVATTYGYFDPDPPALGDSAPGQLDIDIGGTYEVVVYQAERHTEASQYKLTLENFLSARSVCAPLCGDGIVTRNEVCDDGEGENTGAYGHCDADCQGRGPRCGDGNLQTSDDEECDDGANVTPYTAADPGDDACAPGCRTPAHCGDGNIDSLFGEACDDVDNDGGYAQCAPGCQLGERCGDGEIQADHERCDDGNRVNGDGCNANCAFEGPD